MVNMIALFTSPSGSDKTALRTHPGIYPQNFIYHGTSYFDVIICNGDLQIAKKGLNYVEFHKSRYFLVSY